ncbi:MAG: hypothetical protein OSB38_30585 [Paraburkholderia fungorum]|nr:hypothetical protein [Paraburkholderia fungorum]
MGRRGVKAGHRSLTLSQGARSICEFSSGDCSAAVPEAAHGPGAGISTMGTALAAPPAPNGAVLPSTACLAG